MAIQYKEGLQLWVWDSGEIEGFAVYVNGRILSDEVVEKLRFDIDEPDGDTAVVVQFAGADGGATKIVDTTASNAVVAHQDSGVRHGYIIQA